MVPLPFFLDALTRPLVENWKVMQPRERKEKFFNFLWTAILVHLVLAFAVYIGHWIITAPDCSSMKPADETACIER